MSWTRGARVRTMSWPNCKGKDIVVDIKGKSKGKGKAHESDEEDRQGNEGHEIVRDAIWALQQRVRQLEKEKEKDKEENTELKKRLTEVEKLKQEKGKRLKALEDESARTRKNLDEVSARVDHWIDGI